MIWNLVAFYVSMVHDVESECSMPSAEYFDWLSDVASWTKDFIIVTFLDGFTNSKDVFALVRDAYGASGTIVFWEHDIEWVTDMKVFKNLSKILYVFCTSYFVLLSLRLCKCDLLWASNWSHREGVARRDAYVYGNATIFVKSFNLGIFISTS